MTNEKAKKIYEILEPYAMKNLQKIDVRAGNYMGNKMCHHNARQNLETNSEYAKVAAVLMFIPYSGARIHFLNKTVNGDYVDDTLGYLARYNRYFLIKEYSLDELYALDTHRSSMYELLPKHQQEMVDLIKSELKDFEVSIQDF